jgi:hypothetical protein
MEHLENAPSQKHEAVAAIIDTIGVPTMAALLGLSPFSIVAAKRDGVFPAKWYAPLRGACADRGINCPMDAFRWLEPDKKAVESQLLASRAVSE